MGQHGFRVAAVLLGLLALSVYFKIAWVTDDAYISFRSVEQVFDGNGPRWNPHERVQVYTSPLWFWLLVAVRTVSSNAFLNAVLLSALLFIGTLFVLRRGLRDDLAWLACVALLLVSNGFLDYTSSGLENGLAFLLIAMYLDAYRWATDTEVRALRRAHALRLLIWVFSIQLVCRHDLITLTLIPTLYAMWSCRSLIDRRALVVGTFIALGPLATWSLFSLTYYGTALPNTAYAKLSAGLPRSTMFEWGWQYLADAMQHDTITLVGLLAGAAVLLVFTPARGRFLAAGIFVNLAYVIWVGGDFMRGRLLSFGYLTAVAGVAMFVFSMPQCRRLIPLVIGTAALVYGLVYPHTPLNSSRDHKVDIERPLGPIDERGYYWQASLTQYAKRSGVVFPEHPWAQAGYAWGQGQQPFVERGVIGYFGYWAGTEKRILDHFGLADPLLARLPADPNLTYRVGHYRRQLPQGYHDVVMQGQGRLLDPELNAYYEKLCVVTQGEHLFAGKRLKTILAFNLGRYDHYLDNVHVPR